MTLFPFLVVGGDVVARVVARGKPKSSRLIEVLKDNQGKPTITHPQQPPWNSFGNTRQQQLQALALTPKEMSQVEKQINQHVALASLSLGLATAGIWCYTPLTFLSLPFTFYLMRHVFVDCYHALVKRQLTVAILSAISKVALVATGNFFYASFATFLYTLNRKLLTVIKDSSRQTVIDVFRQYPSAVWMLADGLEIQVPCERLKQGDIVVVNAGETIPVDGTIIQGIASIDQCLLTGESQPAEKERDDRVLALTLVLSGRIYVEVERRGEETTAAQIAHLLNRTVDTKTNMQLWAENLSNRTVLPTLVISGIALLGLNPMSAIAIIQGHFKYRAIIVSSIGILNFLNLAAQEEILIKDGRTFELLNQVDTIVFDKTGTLTEAQPYVRQIHTCAGYTATAILRYAAAAEARQSHPIARAILGEAKRQKLSIPEIDAAEYIIGFGITVQVCDHLVHVGSARFMKMQDNGIPPELIQIQDFCYAQGHSLVLVALDNQVVGAIELHFTLRPEVKAVIAGLRQRNIKSMYIISGDHEIPTKKLAEDLRIDHYFAETLPEAKATIIEQLQQAGKSVCYVGDGINDAIALKKAKVSISLRGASSVATDIAEVILMDGRMDHLCDLFDLARQFETNMKVTFLTVFTPTLVTIGGALFLQFGLVHAFLFPQIGLLAGIANSWLPLLRHRLSNTHKVERGLSSPFRSLP